MVKGLEKLTKQVIKHAHGHNLITTHCTFVAVLLLWFAISAMIDAARDAAKGTQPREDKPVSYFASPLSVSVNAMDA